ncbi:hypothetical protein JCM8547_005127 [Rhodosporidiobolus lusitaniae]
MSCSRTMSSMLTHSPLPSSSRSVLPSLFSSIRLFSSSPLTAAAASGRSAAYRPKRDQTSYGLHGHSGKLPRSQWPKRDETNTDNHPLWRFFHESKEPLEVPDKRVDYSGRSWTSFELRRKSFEELHQLWYVLLRERNVLLTQREEARRVRIDLGGFGAVPDKLRLCQKSMARIKQVLSERRHAALQAAEILRTQGKEQQALAMEGEASRLAEAGREEAR